MASNMQEAPCLTSLHDERSAGFLMEVVKEFIPAWRKRSDIDDSLASRRNHLLNPERHAFEFHGDGIKVLDPESEWLIGWGTDFGRLKMMALDRDSDRRRLLRARSGAREKGRRDERKRAADEFERRERYSHDGLP
jgi:hypothetical protein